MSEEIQSTPQKKVLEILVNYLGEDVDANKLTLEAKLEDLGIDSMDVVEIIFDLEETFDIDVPNPGDVEGGTVKFDSVQDLINIVKNLIDNK